MGRTTLMVIYLYNSRELIYKNKLDLKETFLKLNLIGKKQKRKELNKKKEKLKKPKDLKKKEKKNKHKKYDYLQKIKIVHKKMDS